MKVSQFISAASGTINNFPDLMKVARTLEIVLTTPTVALICI